MHLDRHLGKSLHKGRNKFTRGTGCEDAGHILDREGVDAHRLLLLRELHVLLDGVDRRGGVADRALGVPAVLLDAGDRLLEVARIVQRVEDAEDVHAVFTGKRGEALDDIVRVMLVAEDVLAAEQHLKRRLLADGLDLAETLPRIFAEEAHAHVKRGATPAFKGVVAGVVDLLGDLENVIRPQTRGPKGLMGVAQGGVGNADFLHSHCHFLLESRYSTIFLRLRIT